MAFEIFACQVNIVDLPPSWLPPYCLGYLIIIVRRREKMHMEHHERMAALRADQDRAAAANKLAKFLAQVCSERNATFSP